VPPGVSEVATMRKEVRSLTVGAAAHIVDRFGGKTGVPKLKLDELA
jgi:hypothetical protein